MSEAKSSSSGGLASQRGCVKRTSRPDVGEQRSLQGRIEKGEGWRALDGAAQGSFAWGLRDGVSARGCLRGAGRGPACRHLRAGLVRAALGGVGGRAGHRDAVGVSPRWVLTP